jgi:hypothetical protein
MEINTIKIVDLNKKDIKKVMNFFEKEFGINNIMSIDMKGK